MRVRGVEQASIEFAEFYESARDECLRIVLLNVGDRHLAHDLVAEAYTRAWIVAEGTRAGGAAGWRGAGAPGGSPNGMYRSGPT